ncbi:MAG: histidine kinase [Gammaproteobacteria bacterium CG22_combo_CG10-13_8_21_14_all_40_8]|nr:MAG: histidine kinase [Gammaproteobacteria bacterium CG22_combo_CG10-13_8_21_14_all_40_8]
MVSILSKPIFYWLGYPLSLSLLASSMIILIMFSFLFFYFSLIGKTHDIFTPNMFLSNLVGIFPMVIIWSILYVAINYLIRWKQSEIEKLQLETSLKDAQMNTLIGQINPHFMFNSLNNIRGLMLEDVDKARDMVTLLSKVLRHSLASHKKNFISIKEELEIVENFLALAKIQLENRLDYQPHIQVNNWDFAIPPMIIQMMVENAIKHGISEVKGGGVLSLSIIEDGEKCHIQMTNPGALDKPSRTSTSTGVGLENIQNRVQLLYQGKAHFQLTEQDGLVTATLDLPITGLVK